MRRISDGVKTNERYKTTDSVEKAFIDESKYNYLYQDGDNYVFMEPNNFEQIHVPGDIIGDGTVYLAENMEVLISQYNGVPIWRSSIPSRWSKGRPRLRPSSRPCSPMACGRWSRRTSTRARASWFRPKMALISNAPRNRMTALPQ